MHSWHFLRPGRNCGGSYGNSVINGEKHPITLSENKAAHCVKRIRISTLINQYHNNMFIIRERWFLLQYDYTKQDNKMQYRTLIFVKFPKISIKTLTEVLYWDIFALLFCARALILTLRFRRMAIQWFCWSDMPLRIIEYETVQQESLSHSIPRFWNHPLVLSAILAWISIMGISVAGLIRHLRCWNVQKHPIWLLFKMF